MTEPTADHGEDRRLHPVIGALAQVAAMQFGNLGFFAPDGVLDLPIHLGPVRAIRLEVPAGQDLQLQSIGIDAVGVNDIVEVALVGASSWQYGDEQAFDPARLFDFDLPTGTVIHTRVDDPAWVQVRFSRALTVRRLRLRNASVETGRQARGLRISARSRWRTRVIYDGRVQLREWRDLVEKAKVDIGSDEGALALLEVLDLTVRGKYARAHRSLASGVGSEQHRRWLRDALNDELLPSRGLEWTAHGPRRPFRSWSEAERLDYVRETAGVIEALQSLSPDVCLGFGSVLSVVRDRALIPHDDDLDVIIAFDGGEAATLADALRRVEEHMRPLGYEVTGGFAAHRHVRRPGRKAIDVFVGVFEGESISWYPGARGGLTRTIVFPPTSADLLGVTCPIPAQPEIYLERLYGQGWRVPDPYFNHAWNLAAYADIAGTRPPAVARPVADDGAVELEGHQRPRP